MMSGALLAKIDPIPRTRMVVGAPGVPEVLEMVTPATFPSRVFDTSEVCALDKPSLLMTAAEPVKADFLVVP